jgi:hypothetical protein
MKWRLLALVVVTGYSRTREIASLNKLPCKPSNPRLDSRQIGFCNINKGVTALFEIEIDSSYFRTVVQFPLEMYWHSNASFVVNTLRSVKLRFRINCRWHSPTHSSLVQDSSGHMTTVRPDRTFFPLAVSNSHLVSTLYYLLILYLPLLLISSSYRFNPLKTEFLLNSIYESSSYLTGNTLRLRYKDQPVNAVWENNRCLRVL